MTDQLTVWPVSPLRVKGPAGAHADLWAVWQSGLCLHLQKVQEVLFYSVCETVRPDREHITISCWSPTMHFQQKIDQETSSGGKKTEAHHFLKNCETLRDSVLISWILLWSNWQLCHFSLYALISHNIKTTETLIKFLRLQRSLSRIWSSFCLPGVGDQTVPWECLKSAYLLWSTQK